MIFPFRSFNSLVINSHQNPYSIFLFFAVGRLECLWTYFPFKLFNWRYQEIQKQYWANLQLVNDFNFNNYFYFNVFLSVSFFCAERSCSSVAIPLRYLSNKIWSFPETTIITILHHQCAVQSSELITNRTIPEASMLLCNTLKKKSFLLGAKYVQCVQKRNLNKYK